jgi:hypothetical protein
VFNLILAPNTAKGANASVVSVYYPSALHNVGGVRLSVNTGAQGVLVQRFEKRDDCLKTDQRMFLLRLKTPVSVEVETGVQYFYNFWNLGNEMANITLSSKDFSICASDGATQFGPTTNLTLHFCSCKAAGKILRVELSGANGAFDVEYISTSAYKTDAFLSAYAYNDTNKQCQLVNGSEALTYMTDFGRSYYSFNAKSPYFMTIDYMGGKNVMGTLKYLSDCSDKDSVQLAEGHPSAAFRFKGLTGEKPAFHQRRVVTVDVKNVESKDDTSEEFFIWANSSGKFKVPSTPLIIGRYYEVRGPHNHFECHHYGDIQASQYLSSVGATGRFNLTRGVQWFLVVRSHAHNKGGDEFNVVVGQLKDCTATGIACSLTASNLTQFVRVKLNTADSTAKSVVTVTVPRTVNSRMVSVQVLQVGNDPKDTAPKGKVGLKFANDAGAPSELAVGELLTFILCDTCGYNHVALEFIGLSGPPAEAIVLFSMLDDPITIKPDSKPEQPKPTPKPEPAHKSHHTSLIVFLCILTVGASYVIWRKLKMKREARIDAAVACIELQNMPRTTYRQDVYDHGL